MVEAKDSDGSGNRVCDGRRQGDDRCIWGEDFVKRLELEGDAEAGERVLWFKNWIALQSVRGLERIHVLVRDVPEAIIEEWTGEMAHEA